MMQHDVQGSDDLDVATVARKKIAVFGSEARPIMLARAESFRRHGHVKTAKFWQAVADAVAAISGAAPNP